jgi:xanthine dehydrogenase accessory factor
MKIWPVVERALSAHGTCVMIAVVRAQGSTPREEGARMIVTPQGFHGTIGGGALEWKALAMAQAMLGKPVATRLVDQSLGPDLGQCCGGRVKLAIEAFDRSSLPVVERFAARELQGSFEISGRIAGLDVSERFGAPRRAVLVFGAGHVGRATVLALAPLPYDVTWVDPRPEAFPAAAPSNASLIASDPLAVVTSAPQGALAFVMSHSHALDLEIVGAALRNPRIAHVGVIGSATKRARFEKRLHEAGVDAARIASLICPIGIGGLRSKLPAAIAVGVVAQIIALDDALTSCAENHAHSQKMAVG